MKSPWILTVFALVGCAEATVVLSGTITDATSGDPLEGVEVCFDEPADIDCLQTDADGEGSADLPINSDLKVRLTKTGYPEVLTHGNTEEVDLVGAQVGILSEEAADAALTLLGLTRDATKGHVLFVAATNVTLQSKVAGVTADLTATTGTQFYATTAGLPDTGLDATTTAGAGAIVNIDPGDYEMTFTHDTATCVDGYAWPTSSQPESGITVEVPVEAGVITFVSAYCN